MSTLLSINSPYNLFTDDATAAPVKSVGVAVPVTSSRFGGVVNWSFTFSSAPSSCTIQLQGAPVDEDAQYTTIDTSNLVSGEARTKSNCFYPWLRAVKAAQSGAGNLTLTVTATSASAGGTGGEIATAANVGAGTGVFKTKSGTEFQFKTLTPGTGVTLTPGTDTVQIDATGAGGGEVNLAANVGTSGVGTWKNKTGVTLNFKKINSATGARITVTDDTGNDEIDLDVNEANLVHNNIGGTLGLAKGGTNANLSATGPGFLKQASGGANVTVATLVSGDLPTHTHTKSQVSDLQTITATPTADSIPLASGSGKLDNAWLNTGAGNGIEADLLDGQHGSYYAASSHTHAASAITSGVFALARGGVGIDLSTTGGTGQVLKQTTLGGLISVGVLTSGDLPSHTHTGTQISDLSESIDDRVNSLLLAGIGIQKTYDDANGTLTVEVVPNTTQQQVGVRKGVSTTYTRPRISLIEGTNITIDVTDDATDDEVNVTVSASGGAGGYGTVQEEGSGLTQRATINFIGAAITAADDSGNLRTNVTIDTLINAIASLSASGIIARTSSSTSSARTITGTTNQITVSNGNGVSGDPVLSLPTDLRFPGQARPGWYDLGTTAGPTLTVDWNNGNRQKVVLTGNITTLTLNNPVIGSNYALVIVHSGGDRTITWPASVIWSPSAPTLAAGTNNKDVVGFLYDNVNYMGSHIGY